MHDNRSNAMRFVAIGENGDPQALFPGPLGEISHVPLAAIEAAVSILGIKDESLEIAKPVEQQTGDFSGVPVVAIVPMPGRRMMPAAAIAGRRGDDGARIAAERRHPAGDLSEVPFEHGPPTVGVRDRLGNPAQDR